MESERIHKRVRIPKTAESLFDQFATEFTLWWPRARDEVGESAMQTLAFERAAGGKIYARLKDGSERRWGTVEVWNPPEHLRLAFHPDGRDSGTEVVEVTFEEEDGETLVSLHHSGWESLGDETPAAEDYFETGWEPVLGRLAEEEEESV